MERSKDTFSESSSFSQLPSSFSSYLHPQLFLDRLRPSSCCGNLMLLAICSIFSHFGLEVSTLVLGALNWTL